MFLFLEAAATVIKNKLPLPRRYRHRGSGSAAMDISDVYHSLGCDEGSSLEAIRSKFLPSYTSTFLLVRISQNPTAS
jgi:hypothetical protein